MDYNNNYPYICSDYEDCKFFLFFYDLSFNLLFGDNFFEYSLIFYVSCMVMDIIIAVMHGYIIFLCIGVHNLGHPPRCRLASSIDITYFAFEIAFLFFTITL